MLSKKLYEFKKNEADKMRKTAIGYADRVNPEFAKAPEIASNEENVLGLLLLYPEHRKKVILNQNLSEDDFFTAFGKRVFRYVLDLESEGEKEDINLIFSPDEVGRITKMKFIRMKLTDNGDGAFDESVKMLKKSIDKKNATNLSSVSDLDRFLNSIRNKEKDGN